MTAVSLTQAIQVPTISGEPVLLEPRPGAPIVIVGPNGAGKSALSGYLGTQFGAGVNRILAHRRLWLNSSGPDMTQAQLANYTWDGYNNSPDSRWRDQADSARVSSIIVELMDRQNGINSAIARKLREDLEVNEKDLEGPLEILNLILAAAALKIVIDISVTGEMTCKNSNSGATYPAAEMSDGEKAALLLVGDVLVAEPGSLHIIDEPERHLHRSISASLITSLISIRSSDTFIIFTHDLELAHTLGRVGRTLVCSGCSWAGKIPAAWSLDEVPQGEGLPEELRRSVLGGRSAVAFHEGVSGGLDQQLYEALLPGWTVTAAGNCSAVLRSVGGLSAQESLHWIRARGIVDKDFRRNSPPPGIVHLLVHEVENVFYHSEVLEHIAALQAASLGKSSSDLLANAFDAMRSSLAVAGVRANILDQRCLQAIRDGLADQVELVKIVPSDGLLTLSQNVDVAAFGAEYDSAVAAAQPNLDEFLQHFPVRESGLRAGAARALLYPSSEIYEQAVIQQVKQSDGLRDKVLTLTGLVELKDS